MRDVAVIGVGMTKWGELWEKSLRDMFVEAALLALEDAGVDRIDSIVVGCMSCGLFIGQEHLGLARRRLSRAGPGPRGARRIGLRLGRPGPPRGVHRGRLGPGDVVLVGGVEKMTDVSGSEATYALGTAADQEYEGFHGVTFPGLYAMMAVRPHAQIRDDPRAAGHGRGQEPRQRVEEPAGPVSRSRSAWRPS